MQSIHFTTSFPDIYSGFNIYIISFSGLALTESLRVVGVAKTSPAYFADIPAGAYVTTVHTKLLKEKEATLNTGLYLFLIAFLALNLILLFVFPASLLLSGLGLRLNLEGGWRARANLV